MCVLLDNFSYMSNSSKTFLIGRNAGTGKLAKVEKAREHPKTYVVERMPKKGYGDTTR
jgi:hypothetical protein